jgi:hypothetical protein
MQRFQNKFLKITGSMYCMSNACPVLQTNYLNFHLFTLHRHETWYCTGRNQTATEVFQPENYEVTQRGSRERKIPLLYNQTSDGSDHRYDDILLGQNCHTPAVVTVA